MSNARINDLIALGADIRQKSSDGYTALMMAAETGNVDIVGKFIGMGCDVRAKDSKDGAVLDYTKVYSGHYRLKNDSHEWMMGARQADSRA